MQLVTEQIAIELMQIENTSLVSRSGWFLTTQFQLGEGLKSNYYIREIS